MTEITRERSPHWPAVEKALLKKEPICQACGTDQHLNVHHIKPFHLYPELELEPTNLITLCMSDTKCHIQLGHGDDFKEYNPNVVEDVKTVRENFSVQLLTEIAAKAKINRLSE